MLAAVTSFLLSRPPIALAALLALCLAAAPALAASDDLSPPDESALRATVGAELLARVALERNPGLRAVERRASATDMRADAESRMPAPEAEVLLQRIPVSKPYDVPGSQMIMLGLRQPIPAPGSLSARRDMRSAQSRELRATVAVMRRQLAREVEHAFVDYWEARARSVLLRTNKAESDRIAAFAKARYVAGGPLTDQTQAEVESAMVGASIAEQDAKAEAARSRLNALLLRPADAPLGEPAEPANESVAEPTEALIRRAAALRPEIGLARTHQATLMAEANVAEREAQWPAMSVGVFYYAPTRDMPGSGYGASFMSTLPWAWGRASDSARASHAMSSSAADDVAEAETQVSIEIATYAGAEHAAESRYLALRDSTLPASLRAADAASSGYESGRTDVLMLLSARRAVVDVQSAMLEARAAIQHALVDLDWAAGGRVGRRSLPTFPPTPE